MPAPTNALKRALSEGRVQRGVWLDLASPLVADLLARGRARVDPLRIVLEVDGQCRLVDVAGRPSARIFAIGPVSRAAFWEITAIPDIRHQVAALAGRLAQAGAPA